MNLNGLKDLDLYFGATALGIMLIILIAILLGLKFRSIGYKIFVVILSLGLLIPVYFCFRHELNFPIIGTLFLIESLAGFLIAFNASKY
jgi:hypothetical protein